MAQPAQKKTKCERMFLFAPESMIEGHPEKLCDLSSWQEVDSCLRQDLKDEVACETAAKDNDDVVATKVTNTWVRHPYLKQVRMEKEKKEKEERKKEKKKRKRKKKTKKPIMSRSGSIAQSTTIGCNC